MSENASNKTKQIYKPETNFDDEYYRELLEIERVKREPVSKYAFGQKLKAFREERGLSLRDVADALGCSAVYIHYVEKAKRVMSFTRLMDLLKIYEVPTCEWKDWTSIMYVKIKLGRYVTDTIRFKICEYDGNFIDMLYRIYMKRTVLTNQQINKIKEIIGK